jgi:hypothetical protein
MHEPETHLKIGVCVPTFGRDAIPEFLGQWRPFWRASGDASMRVHVFVHEDQPQKSLDPSAWPDLAVTSTCHEDLARELGSDAWIIPRGTGACRSFPMYLAWKAGAEFIITLDHDCFPVPGEGEQFLESHLASFRRDRWFRTIDGDQPRGVPYQRLGRLPVRVNHGLWREEPDLDGPTSLVRIREPRPVVLRSGHDIVPPGMAFPLCAMNVCYHRSIVPAAYNLLMGLDTVGFDRFDDIWSGLLIKRILDHQKWYAATGEPFVRHAKKSNCFSNLRKEALGIQIHEHLWDYILDAPLEPGLTVCGAYRALARWLSGFPKACPGLAGADTYFPRLAAAMDAWSALFDDGGRGDQADSAFASAASNSGATRARA